MFACAERSILQTLEMEDARNTETTVTTVGTKENPLLIVALARLWFGGCGESLAHLFQGRQ